MNTTIKSKFDFLWKFFHMEIEVFRIFLNHVWWINCLLSFSSICNRTTMIWRCKSNQIKLNVIDEYFHQKNFFRWKIKFSSLFLFVFLRKFPSTDVAVVVLVKEKRKFPFFPLLSKMTNSLGDFVSMFSSFFVFVLLVYQLNFSIVSAENKFVHEQRWKRAIGGESLDSSNFVLYEDPQTGFKYIEVPYDFMEQWLDDQRMWRTVTNEKLVSIHLNVDFLVVDHFSNTFDDFLWNFNLFFDS